MYNRAIVSITMTGILLFLCGFSARQALPTALQQPEKVDTQEVYESKPAASLVGEFRTTLASYLFGKAHEYLHGGVIFRAATDAEIERGARTASHGDGMQEHHGAVPQTSVVPEPERDFRFPWGWIERNTQPYMDIRSHGHRDLEEALPLFRMMTWSDPHFVEAYSMGAYLIFCAHNGKRKDEAMDFLQEGICNNPNSYVLHGDAAQFYSQYYRDYERSVQHGVRAIEILQRLPQDAYDPVRAEQVLNSLVLAYRLKKDRENEIAWARRGLQMFPLSPVCRNTFRRYGIPLPRLAPASGGTAGAP